MKLFILCLVLLSVNVFTFNIFVKDHDKKTDPNDDRVQVDFYYESLCPYCQQFMQRSLKAAAQAKVKHLLLRISGKYVTSSFSPTEMQEEQRMALMTGASPANTEPENAKETSLKHVPLNFTPTTMSQRPFPSWSALRLRQLISWLKERNAPLNTDWTGTRSTAAQLQSREGNTKLRWEKLLMHCNQLINMFLGLLSTKFTPNQLRMQFNQTWSNTSAPSTRAHLKLRPAIDSHHIDINIYQSMNGHNLLLLLIVPSIGWSWLLFFSCASASMQLLLMWWLILIKKMMIRCRLISTLNRSVMHVISLLRLLSKKLIIQL